MQEFPDLGESANATMLLLVRSGEAFLALADRALRHHRLSRGGRQALAVLDGAGGPLSPTAIAERLLVTTASVTSLLDTLERRGLLERTADPDDRRRLLVALTEAGRVVVDQFLPEVVALQTAAMTNLSEPQRRQLSHLLGLVENGMATIDPAAVVGAAPRRGRPRSARDEVPHRPGVAGRQRRRGAQVDVLQQADREHARRTSSCRRTTRTAGVRRSPA